jgi:hypothetical protein
MFPGKVETYYTSGIYPYIGMVQRILLGWIPFSVGDLLYAFAGLWLIFQLVKLIGSIKRKETDKNYFKRAVLRTIKIMLVIYILFNALWGLNYNRYGIDYQLHLQSSDYNDTDLLKITRELAAKMNQLQPSSEITRTALKKKSFLFGNAVSSYKNLSGENKLFTYDHPSVKPSIYSYLGNYLGFTGYYNPFTGEAQVNTTVPLFIRPFTTCHEIGHQLGYAKESEANFAAYLSGSASADSCFLYSVYFELYAYSSRYLYYSDSIELKKISAGFSPGVKKDIKELRTFLKRYDTALETAIDNLYSQYLMANEQPSGKMSYNEVVGMLIAYYKKNGKI